MCIDFRRFSGSRAQVPTSYQNQNVLEMSVEIKETPRRVLEFLYWEGQVDPNYLTIGKIRDETDLTDANVQDGLKILHENKFVVCNIREMDIKIIEAKITNNGIERAKSLLNI